MKPARPAVTPYLGVLGLGEGERFWGRGQVVTKLLKQCVYDLTPKGGCCHLILVT